MGADLPVHDGQILTGPLFNEPMRVEPVRDPARLNWHEVTKVAHYHLSVDALTRPDLPAGRQVQVREPEPPPYGGSVP